MQSTARSKVDLHVAIIMDGNGRWALRRGLPRSAGHCTGVQDVRRAVESAPDFGIGTLTLFAFSSDNWRRPAAEVSALMALLRQYLRAELGRLVDGGARLSVIGRRDRLPDDLRDEIARAESATAAGERLDLQIALDYSARDAIANAAAAWLAEDSPAHQAFGRLLAWQGKGPGRDVDLLIRTGGEKRLSDFLLWECAYAEFYFTRCMWPEFTEKEFLAALGEFEMRERRFGGVPAQAAS